MRNYYLIGAKRGAGKGKWDDLFGLMLKAKVVDVGYAWNIDLTGMYGEDEETIKSFLKGKTDYPKSVHAHKLFLTMRPGDLVAVKRFAAPMGKTPRLVICGYAVVKAKKGIVYHYEKGHRLPHQINVDFLLADKDREFPIGGYGMTISRLSKPDHIKQIFAPLGKLASADREELENKSTVEARENALRSISEYSYSIHKRVKVSPQHNKLQNRLYEQLVKIHGSKCVLMEKDRVDIQVRIGNEATLYEIKPFQSAFLCLRDALGQIMLYAWRNHVPNLKMNLVIAGPCKMTKNEEDFLSYLQQHFGQGLRYLAIG